MSYKTPINIDSLPKFSSAFVSLLVLGLIVLGGCGGAKFERAAGVKKFRALPPGTTVVAQDSIDGLTTPVLVIGTIKLDTKTKVKTPNAKVATDELKKYAARYGCDAVVGATSKASTKVYKKKTKRLGADGRPVFTVTATTVWTHHWKAQCVRTAKAPKEVRLRRDKYGRLRPVTKTKTAAAATSTGTTTTGSASTPGTQPKAAPAATAAPAPAPKAAPKEAPKATPTAAPAAAAPVPPPADTGDPKMASEVARAFMTFSRYAAAANTTMLCKMLDAERVYFDIRTREPAHRFKKDMAPAAACESMKSGDLANYLRDFGPAEVHAEIPTLIPSLFRIHSGAFLKLDPTRDQLYRQKLAESRKGKKALQCEMYSVLPAGNLFKVMLDCRGVRSYRLLLRRDAPNNFKLMALTHVR
ncbi:MAG: hypothetical protein KC502_13240 [Myxococcales bacterium]|nr:hypothetical protein [Myxococcales bacterium]